MASQQFLYKPISEHGPLVVLTPQVFNNRIDQVEILDDSGNVIEQGNFAGNQHNGNRGHFRFSKPGNAYAGGQVRISFDDGTESMLLPIQQGERFTADFDTASNKFGSPSLDAGGPGSLGGGGGGGYNPGGYGPSIGYDDDGDPFVIPGAADYTSLIAPFVNFGASLALAQQVGQGNRETFFKNIGRSKDYALDLVDTDIEGILRGYDSLIPRAREEGDRDTQTNIGRAGQIDDYNLARIPGFNAFNRREVAENNRFNEQEFRASVENTGIDYRDRIGKVLDSLSTRARTGNLGGELDDALSTELANRGSELGRASGISPTSRAGIRANDRLTINERVKLALDAESRIPGVAGQAQQLLQAPVERAPTIYGQPTQVPLNVSTISDRIPLTPNISAGAAQQALATQATSLETISPGQVLNSSLATEQFNETGRYNRDLLVTNAVQGQITAQGDAIQGAINADVAEDIRDQAFEMAQQGLDIRKESQQNAAYGSILGGIAGLAGSAVSPPGQAPGGGGNPVVDSIISGGGAIYDAVVGGAGEVIDFVGGAVDSIFGDGDGVLEIGGQQITSQAFDNMLTDVGNFFKGTTIGAPPLQVNGQQVSGTQTNAETGEREYVLEDGTVVPETEAKDVKTTGLTGIFDTISQPFEDLGLDFKAVRDIASTIQNFENMTAGEQIAAPTKIGVGVLQNKGLVSSEEARDIDRAANALAVIASPDATDAQKATAAMSAVAGLATTSFEGNISRPTAIGGRPVVGQDSSGNFMVAAADGSITTHSQQDLRNASNAQNAINAFSVLNSRADTERKIAALTAIGTDAAVAHNIVSEVQGGNVLAGLSVFQTAMNWGDMNTLQKAVSVAQTSNAVVGAAAQGGLGTTAQGFVTGQTSSAAATGGAGFMGGGGTGAGAGGGSSVASTFGTIAAGVGAVGGIGLGIHQAADVFSASEDMSKSQAEGFAAGGGALAGASVGAGVALGAIAVGAAAGSAVPVIGTAIGAAVGATVGLVAANTGTGKNSGQIMRDGWREGLSSGGFTNDKHEVTLADGSSYNLGYDGNHKLENKGVNIDGKTQRHTFDVDWSNEVAVESIPAGHLYAIATGLDPTSNEKMGLFQRSMAQGLNAATSNASSVREVQNNYRAMMKNVNPVDLGMRLETLRAQNRISDQEYGVYLDQTNKIFGSQLQPVDRETGIKRLTDMLVNKKDMTNYDRSLLKTLQDPKKLKDYHKNLMDRIDREHKNLSSRGRKKGSAIRNNTPRKVRGRRYDISSTILMDDNMELPDHMKNMIDSFDSTRLPGLSTEQLIVDRYK